MTKRIDPRTLPHLYADTDPYHGCGICGYGPGALVHDLWIIDDRKQKLTRTTLDDDTLAFVKERALAQKPPPLGTTRNPENEAYNWAQRCLDVIIMLEEERKGRANGSV